jgi:hypothetical protein
MIVPQEWKMSARAEAWARRWRVDRQVARGRIEVGSHERIVYREQSDGPDLVELHITERFVGDIEGPGTVRFLQAARKDGSASLCGIELVEGSLAGRSGSFLLQDEATREGTTVRGRWWVIPRSGTGGLAGLRGEGDFEAESGRGATWTLEYWFE